MPIEEGSYIYESEILYEVGECTNQFWKPNMNQSHLNRLLILVHI